MPSVALPFTPVAPASAGPVAAASGATTADAGLFSSKIGDLLKAGSVPDERPTARGLPPSVSAIASAASSELPEDDAAPSVVDAVDSAATEEVAQDRASPEKDLAAAPIEATAADVATPVASPALATNVIAPPPTPVESSAEGGEGVSQAAPAPQHATSPTDAAPPSDASIAGGAGLPLPADVLAASAADVAIPPPPEPILKAARAALAALNDTNPEAKTVERPSQDKTSVTADARTQSAATSAAAVTATEGPASPPSDFATTEPMSSVKAQASVAAGVSAEPSSQAIQIVASRTTASGRTQSSQSQPAGPQPVAKAEQLDKIDLKILAKVPSDTASETTEAKSSVLVASIKDAETSETSDRLVAAMGETASPAKPLRHGDRASVSAAATEMPDKPVTTESSNARKPATAEAAPAAATASPAPTPVAVSVSSSAVAPEIVQAVAPQDLPTQQTVSSMDRNPLASHLSHATIETTAHLAAQVARKLDGRSTRFDMVLTPEDLGRVDVSLEIGSDGQLAARLAFDNPAAAAELRGRADELRRQLQDAGFQVAGDALDFSQRDPSAGGGAFERQQQRNALFNGGSRLAREADGLPLPAPGAWTTLSQTPDRVDLKV